MSLVPFPLCYHFELTTECYCCHLSRFWILAVKAINWSERCAMASSFILSLSLNDWFNSSSSSILLWISAPCLSSWCTFRNVRYGPTFLNISALSESFFRQYVEPMCPMKYSEKSNVLDRILLSLQIFGMNEELSVLYFDCYLLFLLYPFCLEFWQRVLQYHHICHRDLAFFWFGKLQIPDRFTKLE